MAKVGAKPGSTHKRQRPQTAERRDALEVELRECPPLFSTYDAPKPEGAYFDEEKAQHAVDWIEGNLLHFKGRWAGRPFLLLPWQKRLTRELFGWMRADGFRLYRNCYVEAPRKTGKTSFAAAVALYLAHADGEPGCEVCFAAYDKDQAKLCYKTAQHMVEASEDLFANTLIYNSSHTMHVRDNPGSEMKVLSRESAKQFGLNLHGLIFDELMTQKSRDMWSALTTSHGAREQPILFAISTAGWEQQSICYEQHELVREIQEGTAEDPEFLGVVYGAPVDADWTDEEVWLAANPSLNATTDIEFYRGQATRAKNQPAEQNAFRTLYLSQWVGQAERFIDMERWDACAEAPDRVGKAFGGLDLSTTTDLTALTVLVEGRDIYSWAFLPEEGILDREKRDRVPYRLWAQEGYLTLTPGRVVDYSYVKAAAFEAAERFDLQHITFDRWNSSQIVQELEEEGIEMVPLGQGYASMSTPVKEMVRKIVEAQYRHGGNPLLRWCASNVAAEQDPAGNVKLAKNKSTGRFDPIQALAMAEDGWQRLGNLPPATSVYEQRFAA